MADKLAADRVVPKPLARRSKCFLGAAEARRPLLLLMPVRAEWAAVMAERQGEVCEWGKTPTQDRRHLPPPLPVRSIGCVVRDVWFVYVNSLGVVSGGELCRPNGSGCIEVLCGSEEAYVRGSLESLFAVASAED